MMQAPAPQTPPPPPPTGGAPAAAAQPPTRPPITLRRALRWGFYGLVAANVGNSLITSWRAWKEYVTLPPAFFLELDLEQHALVERSSSNPLRMLAAAGRELELHHLTQVLHTAKEDERVRGLLAVLGERHNFGGLAQLQELRNALLDFRFHAKGRAPVYAYTNAFGEGGTNGTGLYYLASAADRVFMPPSGMLSLIGFETTQVFIRGLLDRLKVTPQVFRREEYKAALTPLTDTEFDPAHKRNITELLGSMYDQVVEGIASARRLTPAAVRHAIDAAPLLPSQAVQMQLLDGLMYRDQVEQQLLLNLPAAAQKQAQQQQQEPPAPRRGVTLAAAFRSAQLAGPRVSLQRYSLATQYQKSLQEFWGGGSSGSSSSGATPPTQQQQGAGGAQGTAAAAPQQQQAAQGPPGPGGAPAAAAGGGAGRPAPFGGFGGAGPAAPAAPALLPQDRPIVALVTAAGPIAQQQARGGAADPTGEGVVESHRLVRVLRGLRDNPQVKAVVLRINSPGGSAVASDMIAREVQLLRGAGKPVVACMGDVAASGGYYIAAPCSKILAQPGTVTGSIGVIAMKLGAREALAQYGVTADSLALGGNAAWASPFHELSAQQRQQVDGMIGSTYDGFLSIVAEGRGLSKQAVREVAKGRVWSGSQALEVGLVDELGGVSQALEAAKQLAGLPPEPEASQTVEWPPRVVPLFVKLLQSAGGMPGAPAEIVAPLSSLASSARACCDHAAAGSLRRRAAAGLDLLAMLLSHTLWPGGTAAGHDATGLAQLLAAAAQHDATPQLASGAAAPAGAGVQQQVAALLARASQLQQRPQPELYCLEAGLLACSC